MCHGMVPCSTQVFVDLDILISFRVIVVIVTTVVVTTIVVIVTTAVVVAVVTNEQRWSRKHGSRDHSDNPLDITIVAWNRRPSSRRCFKTQESGNFDFNGCQRRRDLPEERLDVRARKATGCPRETESHDL